MSQCKKVARCIHCGVVLQTDNPKEKGFVSKEILENADSYKAVYCNSCFDNVLNFNNTELNQKIEEDTIKILQDAKASNSLIIYVVDLFSFNATLNPTISNIIKNNDVVVLGTKIDLFPKPYDEEAMRLFLLNSFREYGINPVSIIQVGSKGAKKGAEFVKKLQSSRKKRNIYLIGNSASGKTFVLNDFLKFYENHSKRQIKTLFYKNTSVQVLEIPIYGDKSLYELPGITQQTSIVGRSEKDIHKYLIPKSYIKVTNKTCFNNDAILIGSLVIFSFIKTPRLVYKFYTSENVEFKKTTIKKSEIILNENYINKTIRPVSTRFLSFMDYDLLEFSIDNDNKKHEIAIEGLGWMTFLGKGQIIRVQLPKGTSIKENISRLK